MKKLILLAALMVPVAAQAQWPKPVEARLTATYRQCMASGAAALGQTLAMNVCQSEELERQDARLNQAYVMVMKRLSPRRKASLRRSERAWIAQRDRSCKAAADRYAGGTAAPLEFQGCQLRMTIERTLWLERYR
ncbi:lysozyme inhibitor LprI family protein [Sphingomonas turrisvirgatae]|uniref:lysozyme inhibitor LprI family protein n=1 Tax=Sphingomonas turrisvirgatae TaxID=1888892 RepID=UPI000E5D96A9|nr:lysozyme inhibitor LprI family protein [Sphingomonas turrisvirgatae]